MVEALPYLMLGLGVFLGAIVQGLSGFAFSAVAGAILLHLRPPAEAVPLMMLCSITVQLATLIVLRRTMRWRGGAILIGAGALGVLPAIYLLHNIDTWSFRIGFGIFVAGYAAYMFLRSHPSTSATLRALAPFKGAPVSPTLPEQCLGPSPSSLQLGRLRQWSDVALGFASGLVGGLTAMPGALPTIWCDLTGMSKDQQRGHGSALHRDHAMHRTASAAV
jgi:uncharacterized membrane protein YfcA